MCGPAVIDTNDALALQSEALYGVYNIQEAEARDALGQDCILIGENGNCAQIGLRYGQTKGGDSDAAAGTLVLARQITPFVRLGGYLNLDVNNHHGGSVAVDGANPTVSLFGVWSANEAGSGLETRFSASFGHRDVMLRRTVIGTSEAGRGGSDLNSAGLQALVKYGMPVSGQVSISPFGGIRYLKITRDGYTEDSGVGFRLTYEDLTDSAVTGLGGIEATYRVNPLFSLMGGVDVEQDISRHTGDNVSTGLIGGTTSGNFDHNISNTRFGIFAGSLFSLTDAGGIVARFGYHQSSFDDDGVVDGTVAYQIGF